MEWISVTERLPEIDQIVLSYSFEDGIIQTRYTTYQQGVIGYYEGVKECWFEYVTLWNYSLKHFATHWMPLPPPSKK